MARLAAAFAAARRSLAQLRPDSSFGMGNGNHGRGNEREVSFGATLLKSGPTTFALTVKGGPVTVGVLDDYLRLELDESAPGRRMSRASSLPQLESELSRAR